MKKPLIVTLLVLAVTLFGFYARTPLMTALGFGSPKSFSLPGYTLYRLAWTVLLPAVALALLHGPRRVLTELGWRANPLTGLAVGGLITLPMLLGFALFFAPKNASVNTLLFEFYKNSFWAAVAEETIFRAFLFGQLYRHGRWNFWLAVGVPGLAFGLGHLYQAHDLWQALGVFTVTFLGAVWFTWLWLAWRNLWVSIAVHMLMNGWWGLFNVADSSLGGWVANTCRLLTIGLSIYLTVRQLKKEGRSLNVWDSPAWTTLPAEITPPVPAL